MCAAHGSRRMGQVISAEEIVEGRLAPGPSRPPRLANRNDLARGSWYNAPMPRPRFQFAFRRCSGSHWPWPASSAGCGSRRSGLCEPSERAKEQLAEKYGVDFSVWQQYNPHERRWITAHELDNGKSFRHLVPRITRMTRRTQFRLRSLFILTAVVAVGCLVGHRSSARCRGDARHLCDSFSRKRTFMVLGRS